MRWRGPPDLAAPDTATSCSAPVPPGQTTKPDTRLKSQLPSSPGVRGAPRWFPFSVVRAFLRPFWGAAQGVVACNFKIFWSSTNCPQFSGSYPPVDRDSPQGVHKEGPVPGPAGWLTGVGGFWGGARGARGNGARHSAKTAASPGPAPARASSRSTLAVAARCASSTPGWHAAGSRSRPRSGGAAPWPQPLRASSSTYSSWPAP